MFEPHKNLSENEIKELIRTSKVGAVRTITDPRTGDKWYWKAELATHGWGAKYLDVPYDTYGGGNVLMLED